MKTNINKIILELFKKRPKTYIMITILTILMIIYQSYIVIQENIKTQIEIWILNQNKQKFIDSKVLELKPLNVSLNDLKHQEDTLKSKIDTIQKCIDWVKKTLWTKDIFDCNKSLSLVEKANADELVQEVMTGRTLELYNRIPNNSPLKDEQTFLRLQKISENHNVPFWIALGITNAESSLGINYAPWCDKSYNNLWWIKWRIDDNGNAIKDQPIPDSNGCYLYKFKSVDDYWESKMNTLVKYKTCFTKDKPIKCISYQYVWDPNVAERSWIMNVAKIAY